VEHLLVQAPVQALRTVHVKDTGDEKDSIVSSSCHDNTRNLSSQAERLMAPAKQTHMCLAAQHTKFVKLPLVAAGIATGLAV
jgi:hypothetical protein